MFLPRLCGVYTMKVTERVFSGVPPAIMTSNVSRKSYSSSRVGFRGKHVGQAVSCLTVTHRERTMRADNILSEGQSLSQLSKMGSKALLRDSDRVSSFQRTASGASLCGKSCGRFGVGFVL